MDILGISAFYHDAAAILLRDGEIVAAAQEERFTRKKHDASFPEHAIKYCLEEARVSLRALDAVAFYEKPFLKLERIFETYLAIAPRGLFQFLAASSGLIREKLFIKRLLRGKLKKLDPGFNLKKLLFSEHHLSHAASAFYPSPFQRAAILTVDGVGEWATASIAHGKENSIEILRELHFPHSLGLLYSAFTHYLGFKVNSGEYKLMGLSSFGDPHSLRYKKFVRAIYEEMVEVKSDGSLWLNQEYFDYLGGLQMIKEEKWKKLFGISRRMPESEVRPEHCDLALAVQHLTEDVMLRMAREAQKLTGEENLCLAGGVALNCLANTKILRSGAFQDIWIQPAAGDAGGALGAAYAAYHLYFQKPRKKRGDGDGMKGAYLGPAFREGEIEKMAKAYRAIYHKFDDFEALCQRVANYLDQGLVVGWFQGRMEWGPRALGNRSLLADPRKSEMREKLNRKIKFRESFRPFAPSVLEEDVGKYFDMDRASSYMLFVAPVRKMQRKKSKSSEELSVQEQLASVFSDLPAITHVDGSARLQTVHRELNHRYWQLLKSFKQKTGCGVLLNTSFNVRDEPIVCTPEDAYRCFMRTEIDVLVIENFLFQKEEQPKTEC